MMSAASRRGREAMIASILLAVTAALRQRGRGRVDDDDLELALQRLPHAVESLYGERLRRTVTAEQRAHDHSKLPIQGQVA